MPRLHLQVCAGFANRLRALVSGIRAAESMNLDLVVHWFPKSPECACSYQSILDLKSLPKRVKVVSEDLYQAQEILSRDDWNAFIAHWDGKSDLVMKSYGIFYTDDLWETTLRSLRPSLQVQQVLSERCKGVVWKEAIGIHIRRTDNIKSIQGSPLESFLRWMRARPETQFIVATDDADIRGQLVLEFGSRCVFPAAVLSRRTEAAMIHGAADFFALSLCSQILGSVASSFSEMAARYGNIPLILAT